MSDGPDFARCSAAMAKILTDTAHERAMARCDELTGEAEVLDIYFNTQIEVIIALALMLSDVHLLDAPAVQASITTNLMFFPAGHRDVVLAAGKLVEQMVQLRNEALAGGAA